MQAAVAYLLYGVRGRDSKQFAVLIVRLVFAVLNTRVALSGSIC